MKVLFLQKFPLFGSGSGTYTRKLAEHLAKDPNMTIAIAAPDNRQLPGVKIFTIKLPFRAVFEGHPEWKGARKYSRLSGAQFARIYHAFFTQIVDIVEEFQPDVIHVNHESFLNWIASYIKSFYGIAFVTTAHATGIYQATIDRRVRLLTKQALERAEFIIPVAPHAKKWLLKVFGRKLDKKTKVIPGGIDTKKFDRPIDTTEIETKYKLAGKKVVIFVGRLTKEKGIEYIIKAAKNIRGEIFIIGGGPHKDYLSHLARMKGVKNVHFLGYFGKQYLNELEQFYKRADALLLPSIVEESLGLVILEAMIAETPVIASNKGGIPLVVKHNKNGILIRSRSSKAIEEAVNFIFDNPKKAKEMGLVARKTVIERFDWENITPKISNLYLKTYEITKRLRDTRLTKQSDKFQKEDIEREKRELTQKIGYIT